jgi:hypothetical protein
MNAALQSRHGWLLGAFLVLGAASLAFAQLGGPGEAAKPAPIFEFTQQEVQAALLVQTLNDLGKQRWEVFQIVPIWTIVNQNAAVEMVPKAYQVFGRRPAADAK